jgi:RNA 3'-terminal phosphate cyclase (ATP)
MLGGSGSSDQRLPHECPTGSKEIKRLRGGVEVNSKELPMLTIDGSQGEGGGQILRSSLALSLVTGKPFRIHSIRSRRRRPGLMRQHLTAVQAAARVGAAEVEGDHPGSLQLSFAPKTIHPGHYHFSVGTAGSCTLVLQTVLPALCLAAGASNIVLEGGTHNPFAPPFDFIARAFLPLVTRMGPKVTAILKNPGFYPAGGGRFVVHIEPASCFKPIDLLHRGDLLAYRACATVARLPRHIAEREIRTIGNMLGWGDEYLCIEEIAESQGPGNILSIEVASENITEIFTGFGERKVTAEKVARQAGRQVMEYLAAGVPVGPHLADQLLLPMALAGGGSVRTMAPTLHTTTNIEVIKTFLGIKIVTEQLERNVWEIRMLSQPQSMQ